MLIQKTLQQLQVRADTPERAQELGSMGYIQWLGWLPGGANYEAEARAALRSALPFSKTDPAVSVFCDFLQRSLDNPLVPLNLSLPKPKRRGGSAERRMSL